MTCDTFEGALAELAKSCLRATYGHALGDHEKPLLITKRPALCCQPKVLKIWANIMRTKLLMQLHRLCLPIICLQASCRGLKIIMMI